MKTFDYTQLHQLNLTYDVVNLLTKIHTYQGKATVRAELDPEILDKLVDLAMIQSTKASNSIEGIYTSNTRLRELVAQTTKPKNRDEEEIAGYRHVLAMIHEGYADIAVTPNNVLALHKQLYAYSDKNHRGKFKTQDNQITETDAFGHQQVRFSPAPAYLTPQMVTQLCEAYDQAITAAQIDPLILTACFVFDFLSIHPFLDGNGRLSRLLTLLLLYRAGIKVGRYISLEKLIEESKATYYEALQASSQGWLADQNDYTPFVRYFLGVILKSYQALETRFEIAQDASLTPDQRVLNALNDALIPQSRRELEAAIPECGQRTIERALARLQVAGKIEKRGVGKGTKYALASGV